MGGGHHHHGGGGGHHHGGGGGGGFRGGYGPSWGPGYWAEPSYAELIVTCPEVYAPVLATDGRTYDNECLARTAGTNVVRRVRPGKLGDYVAGVPDMSLLAVAGIAAYLMLRRRRR